MIGMRMATDLVAALKAESWWSNAFKIPTGNYFQYGTRLRSMTSHVLPSFSASLQRHMTGSSQWNALWAKLMCHFCTKYWSASLWPVSALCICYGNPEPQGDMRGELKVKADQSQRKTPQDPPGPQQTWQQEIKLYFCTEISEFLCHCSITYPMLTKQ